MTQINLYFCSIILDSLYASMRRIVSIICNFSCSFSLTSVSVFSALSFSKQKKLWDSRLFFYSHGLTLSVYSSPTWLVWYPLYRLNYLRPYCGLGFLPTLWSCSTCYDFLKYQSLIFFINTIFLYSFYVCCNLMSINCFNVYLFFILVFKWCKLIVKHLTFPHFLEVYILVLPYVYANILYISKEFLSISC